MVRARTPRIRRTIASTIGTIALTAAMAASMAVPASAAPASAAPVAAVPSGSQPKSQPKSQSEPLGTNGAPVPELEWGACPEDALRRVPPKMQDEYECATAEVPLSYRRPHGQTIELAVGRLPAADPERKIGTLFFNPGGPGGSGRIPPKMTKALHKRFDIVGFDPRGTNASTPVRCFT